MNFIEIKQTRTNDSISGQRDTISYSFTKPKIIRGQKKTNFKLSINIGKDIAEKMSLKIGNKVSISYGEENNKIWALKKSKKSGYKLVELRKTSAYLTIQLTWRIFEPKENEMGIKKSKIISLDKNMIIIDAN